jgi:hypothetical protein
MEGICEESRHPTSKRPGPANRESTPQHRDVPTVAIDQGIRDATARFNVQCSSYLLFICIKKLNGDVFSLLPLFFFLADRVY